MGVVVAFRPKVVSVQSQEEDEIDIFTAVDVAIRDLHDITRQWGEPGALAQAEACREMLERAYAAE